MREEDPNLFPGLDSHAGAQDGACECELVKVGTASHINDVNVALVNSRSEGWQVLFGHRRVPPFAGEGVPGLFKPFSECCDWRPAVPVPGNIDAISELKGRGVPRSRRSHGL